MKFGIHRKIDEILLSKEPLSCKIKENISLIELVVPDTFVSGFLLHDPEAFQKVENYCEGLDKTIHLPFYDLNLGSPDDMIANYSVNSLKKSLILAESLGSKICVAHLGYNPLISESATEKWFKRFIRKKEELEKFASDHGTKVVWENTYESDMVLFDRMVETHPDTEFCLDIGHCNCFASFSAIEFLKRFQEKVVHLHIHDNLGKEDSHLVPGKGNIDFESVMKAVGDAKVINGVFEIDTVKFQESINEMKNVFMR
jgi:sugar phosphate isomerase/epimerase